MEFRTQIPLSKSIFSIDYASRIVCLGSCFSENIGEKFQYFKFHSTINPFGIIFNPASLERIIKKTITQEPFSNQDVFSFNELWQCFDVHSEMSGLDKEAVLKKLNETSSMMYRELTQVSHFFITLGTAWVYRKKSDGLIVANCHKVPQKEFSKELMSVEQIERSLNEIISLVSSINPHCHFIITVSPVRHIKDGFTENNRSKSHLITAVHNILDSNNERLNLAYFPSFEIMMDELRDYRFYADDMLHPNNLAIEYIWSRFADVFFDNTTRGYLSEIDSIQKALAHRSFNPNSEQHLKFLKNINHKIEKIQQKLPGVNF